MAEVGQILPGRIVEGGETGVHEGHEGDGGHDLAGRGHPQQRVHRHRAPAFDVGEALHAAFADAVLRHGNVDDARSGDRRAHGIVDCVAKGGEAVENLVFKLGPVLDDFRPGAAFAAEDAVGEVAGQIGEGVEGADALGGDCPATLQDPGAVAVRVSGQPFGNRQVRFAQGRENNIVPLPRRGCCLRRRISMPDLDHRRGGEVAAVEDFVPADGPPAALCEMFHDAPHEPALKRRFIRKPFGADARLASGTGLPARLRAFVASHMDERRGEKVAHGIENALAEGDGLVASGAEDVLANAVRAKGGAGEFNAFAGELRMRRQQGARVSGEVDLRDNANSARGRVGDNLADVVDGVEERAVAGAVRGRVLARQRRRGADGAEAREFRHPRQIDAPPLVVREVPVEDVEAGRRHAVEERLHGVLSEEVARLVKHESAPAGGLRRVLARSCDRGLPISI